MKKLILFTLLFVGLYGFSQTTDQTTLTINLGETLSIDVTETQLLK